VRVSALAFLRRCGPWFGGARLPSEAVRHARRGWLTVAVIAVGLIGSVVAYSLGRHHGLGAPPGCIVTADAVVASATPVEYFLSEEQAKNAATIAAVGIRLGLPDHAVTVALAAALQESGLYNLPDGDRDSAGLFQQRPSQGWGTRAQVLDPVYASIAFYSRLRVQQGWAALSVTDAAQLVQRSAGPMAYAQWEPQARAYAAALTGEAPAALFCRGLTVSVPGADLVATAASELGTTALSGAHSATRGWSISSWLVAHAGSLALDRVTFDGLTWTMASGRWLHTGPADGVLSLHQLGRPA
jgi:hypothetical protein